MTVVRVAFRSVREDADPLYPRPDADDRWIGLDGVEPAICAGDILDGVHAEVAKHFEMSGVSSWVGIQRRLLTADLEIDGFLDLCDDDIRADLSVTEDSLLLDFDDKVLKEEAFKDPRRCYQHALTQGSDGIISHSAAYDGMRVFVVRRDAIMRVVSNPKIEMVALPKTLYTDPRRRRGVPIAAAP